MADPLPPVSGGTRFGATVLVGLAGLAAYAALVPPIAPEEGGATPAEVPLSGDLVVDFVDGTSLADAQALGREAGLELGWATEVSADEALTQGTAADVAGTLARLRASPLVEAAEPRIEMSAPLDDAAASEAGSASQPGAASTAAAPLPAPPRRFGFPDDPLYERQWNLGAIHADAGWRVGGGRGVIVAVIDTGVTPLPELPAERFVEGKSLVPGEPTTDDGNGHGTHVAGTIAQATNNGLGVAGVAPEATILPIKVLNRFGSGDNALVAAGIDEAVDRGAQVINLSLGGGHSDVVVKAVEKARKAGVVVIAAAGNTGSEGIGSPADARAALAVSALGPESTLAPYSSWGKGVEIAAPGGDKRQPGGGILQATRGKGDDGDYAEYQGTSMAAPHVAGAAAVLIGAGVRDPTQVEALLRESATDLGDPLRFGSGGLDVGAAVTRMLLRQRGLLFLTGGLMAAALAMLGGLKGLSRIVALTTGALAAGGAFFLAILPLPAWAGIPLLTRPLLAWPSPFWAGNPLWQSALIPLLVAVTLGPTRTLGPAALGLCAGVGSYLLYGAATGGTGLWWMPLGWGSTWLTLNGTAALLLGMAVAGMQRLRRRT